MKCHLHNAYYGECLLWRVFRNRMPTMDNLSRSITCLPNILCVLCEQQLKTINRLFINYSISLVCLRLMCDE